MLTYQGIDPNHEKFGIDPVLCCNRTYNFEFPSDVAAHIAWVILHFADIT